VKTGILWQKFPGLKRDWLAGWCLGFPVAYPAEPFYPIAFAVFAAMIWRRPISLVRLGAVCLFFFALAVATMTSSVPELVSAPRLFYIAAGMLLFLFGYSIRDHRAFADGFCNAMGLIALAIVAMFFVRGIYQQGSALFVVPELRLWGDEIFPDWPNFIGFGLGAAALMAVLWLDRVWLGALLATAAVLTTSRTPLIAVALILASLPLIYARDWRPASRMLAFCAVIGAAIVFAAWVWIAGWPGSELSIDEQLAARLVKFGDRDGVWSRAIELLGNNYLGLGAVALDDSIGIPSSSIHNSYFDVLLRAGVLGLLAWLLVVLPYRWRDLGWRTWLLVAYFLVASLFNNILKHPHHIMLFSVVAVAGAARVRHSRNFDYGSEISVPAKGAPA
jgi:hypothetical protein